MQIQLTMTAQDFDRLTENGAYWGDWAQAQLNP